MHAPHHLLAAAAALGVVACSESAKPPTAGPTSPRFTTTSVTEPETGPFARVIEGKIGPGALYALYIPRTWNGDAMYYVHGVRDVNSPVDLRNQNNFFATRDLLGAQGFAIAYSSWPANGMVVKEGAQSVHQMRGTLTAALPHPAVRSFLYGTSLGGLVALKLVETYPEQYDGALLACGMLGGVRMEMDYYWNVRMLFDAFYPGVMPGTAVFTPPDAPPVTLKQLDEAVRANPNPLFLIASLAQTPLPYVPSSDPLDLSSSAFADLVNSLYAAVVRQAGSVDMAFDLTHGHDFVDNSTTTYSLGGNPLLPASELQPMVDYANAHVARYTADPAAANYLERAYTPSGDIRIPVLAIHNSADPVSPVFHETAFRAKVVAAGATASLLQRSYPGYGHCLIPPAVMAQNFLDMVNWVTTGMKPES